MGNQPAEPKQASSCVSNLPPQTIPEITPSQLASWLAEKDNLVVFDVREPYEVAYARLDDERVVFVPLSELARRLQDALPDRLRDKGAEIVVLCHLGVRSAQVTSWLQVQGYASVFSLAGGIHAYSLEIDPAIPRY